MKYRRVHGKAGQQGLFDSKGDTITVLGEPMQQAFEVRPLSLSKFVDTKCQAYSRPAQQPFQPSACAEKHSRLDESFEPQAHMGTAFRCAGTQRQRTAPQ